MTREEFREILVDWCRSDVDSQNVYSETKAMIEFFEKVLFEEYVPVRAGDHGAFGLRLARWIGSAEIENDRRNLFLLLRYLFFLGPEDMKSAHLTAYSKNVLSWLIEIGSIPLFSPTAMNDLRQLVADTAFTEITDSFDVSTFVRINNIHGERIRFNWAQHIDNWDGNYFRETVLQNGRKRYLALFEDFVGSGSQVEDAIRVACEIDQNLHVLFCPIIICPRGAVMAKGLANHYANLTYSPVLELTDEHFISRRRQPNENADFQEIRETLINVHTKVAGSHGSWAQWRGPFGYRDTGALIVKFDNCPDNSVPALHHRSDLGWNPLFYRASREPLT